MWSSVGACRIDLRAMTNATLDNSSQRLEKAPLGKSQSGAVADIHRWGGIVRFVPIQLALMKEWIINDMNDNIIGSRTE